ncbi:MAG: hypothetical protein Q9219_000762 [cf. Caloplaca sp. 3 TL-2023]
MTSTETWETVAGFRPTAGLVKSFDERTPFKLVSKLVPKLLSEPVKFDLRKIGPSYFPSGSPFREPFRSTSLSFSNHQGSSNSVRISARADLDGLNINDRFDLETLVLTTVIGSTRWTRYDFIGIWTLGTKSVQSVKHTNTAVKVN